MSAPGEEQGLSVAADDPYRAPSAEVPLAPPDDEGDLALYAAVVGGNFATYRRRWQLDTGRADARATWHWPGFLFGLMWMLYRKMYLATAVWGGVVMVVSVVEELLRVPQGASSVINIVMSVAVATQANRLYLWHCQRRIESARARYPQDEAAQREWLARRGGTSVLALLVGMVLTGGLVALSLLGQ